MEHQRPPLVETVKSECVSSSGSEAVYRGVVSGDWCVGAVPNGGFSLSLLLESCMQYQVSSKHPDPINVTAHFLATVHVEPFEVRIKTIKKGRGFSNLLAELVQKDLTRITAHLIFGVLAPHPSDPGPKLTLAPPSSYARRHPVHSHPSSAILHPPRDNWTFGDLMAWAPDPIYLERNEPHNAAARTNNETIGGGGVEWGSWFELKHERDRLTTPSLCFMADMVQFTAELLPDSENGGMGVGSWHPTIVFNIEFKSPIPRASPHHSSTTVGLYSSGCFLNDPQGRHNTYAEVWTAPCGIGQGREESDWRDKQVCLATSSQMTLCLPMEVNYKRGSKL
ncbi:hypothetical protein HWV62_33693 [Athelia sp. TMB]|nr:hypothetical protein HWV62_33693 [Athelia sp. TMB]